MSLSFWFRDNIYNRFVFTALKNKWFKNRYTASYVGYVITMGLMGLWHGTAWHYIVYGLYHGVLLALTTCWIAASKEIACLSSKAFIWQATSILLTFHLIAIGLLISQDDCFS